MASRDPHVKTLKWDKNTTYQFYSYSVTPPKRLHKCIMDGFFLTDAPKGVKPLERCIVKEATMPDPNSEGKVAPQDRSYYDMLRFQGDHQRELLAQNPEALRIQSSLGTSPRVALQAPCYVVERCYSDLFLRYHEGDSFDDHQDFREATTLWERLEVLRQAALACKELYDSRNALSGRNILAHRDIKLQNFVVEKHPDRFILRLIDYPSIKLEVCDGEPEEEPDAPNGFRLHPDPGTAEGGQSPQNSPPEVLTPDLDIGPWTDVYALGMMVASLFSVTDNDKTNQRDHNPNSAWCRHHGWTANCNQEEVNRALLKDFRQYEDWDNRRASKDRTWLQEYLDTIGFEIVWDENLGEALLDGLKDLFFRATRVDLNKRISIDSFLEEVTRLQEGVPKERSYRHWLYQVPVSAYLFDRRTRGADRAADTYITAAISAYKQDFNARRSRHGMTDMAPLPLCFSFGPDGGDALPAPARLIREPQAEPIAMDPAQGIRLIRSWAEPLLERRATHGTNLYKCLETLDQYLVRHRPDVVFTGRIHVFTYNRLGPEELYAPDNPRYHIGPMLGRKEGLGSYVGRDLEVELYCPEGCEAQIPDTGPWYRAHPLRILGTTSWGQSPPQEDPTPADTPGEEPPAKRYRTGEEGIYRIVGGKKRYVGREV